MMPNNPDEALIARVLADALQGKLSLGFSDVASLSLAARRVKPERVAPLALALWIQRDAHAGEVLNALRELATVRR